MHHILQSSTAVFRTVSLHHAGCDISSGDAQEVLHVATNQALPGWRMNGTVDIGWDAQV